MFFVVTRRNPRSMFLDDLLLAQVFSNFIRCEPRFPICRISAEAALLRGVYLTSGGEWNFVRDEIRSVAVCFNFISFSRSFSRRAKAKSRARQQRGETMMKRAERKLQMNHKTTAGDAAQIHRGRCLEEAWLALPFSSGRLYFQNSGRRRSRKSTIELTVERRTESIKVAAEIEIILHFNVHLIYFNLWSTNRSSSFGTKF